MARVRAHSRTVKGRRQHVGAHNRALKPRRAGKNAYQAYRHARRRQYTAAIVTAGVAAAEIGAWTAFRATGVAVLTVAIAAGAAYKLARRMA